MRRAARTTLLLGLLLAGCSDGTARERSRAADATTAAPSSAAPSTAPSTGPVDAARSFATTEEIRAALTRGGLPCEQPQEGTYEGVVQAQGCILNGSEDVVLLRFGTPAEKAGYLANKDELASVVLGVDWGVQTVLRETAELVAAAIGGEVRPGVTG